MMMTMMMTHTFPRNTCTHNTLTPAPVPHHSFTHSTFTHDSFTHTHPTFTHHTFTHLYTPLHTFTHLYTPLHTFTYTPLHTFTHTHTHPPTHARTHARTFLSPTTLLHGTLSRTSLRHAFFAHTDPPPYLFSFLPFPSHLHLSLATFWKKLTCGVVRSFYSRHISRDICSVHHALLLFPKVWREGFQPASASNTNELFCEEMKLEHEVRWHISSLASKAHAKARRNIQWNFLFVVFWFLLVSALVWLMAVTVAWGCRKIETGGWKR